MQLKVDVYNCYGCGRAVVVEAEEEFETCPYKDCGSDDFEYSHSGSVVNDVQGGA